MIVSISGRQGSGKTLLANELINRGFIKISFADRLKELISELYEVPVNFLNDPIIKNNKLEQSLVWNQKYASRLEKLTNLENLNNQDKVFHSYREAMQFIGTSVLRSCEDDFHIKEFNKKIIHGENYVLDDARFKNEINLLKSKDAFCVYIIRPYNFQYSNHISETQLSRDDFKYHILNDASKQEVLYRFNVFLDVIFKNSYIDVFSKVNNLNSYWAGFISSCGVIKECLDYYVLEVTNSDLKLIECFKYFLKSNENVMKTTKSDGNEQYSLRVVCPYMIDDLKKWNIDKFGFNVPECVNNVELSYWNKGVADGKS